MENTLVPISEIDIDGDVFGNRIDFQIIVKIKYGAKRRFAIS